MTPLDKVGVYVPGGKAVYPSSVLMNVVPAKVAGVPHIYMTTPPGPDGKVYASTLVAAKEAGVDSFWYKEPSSEVILDLIERTMNGEHIYPDSTPHRKIGGALSTEFTEQELKILRELTSGDTDEEIAANLHLSIWTVRKYVKIMLEKTQFKSRT